MQTATKGAPGYAIFLPWNPNSIGGVSMVARQLYGLLELSGKRVPHFVVCSWDPAEAARISDMGSRTVELRVRSPFDGRSVMAVQLLQYLVTLPGQLLNLRRLVASKGISTVNCHYVGWTSITWAIARRLGIFRRLLLSFHGTDLHQMKSVTGLRRTAFLWACRNADAIIAPSANLAEGIRQLLLPKRGNVTVIYNGVDVQEIRAKAEVPGARQLATQGTEQTGPLIVNIGSFEHVKGHDTLLLAAAKLAIRQPNIRLIIAGREGQTLGALRASLEALNLQSCCSLVVNASHEVALGLMAVADVVVISSRREALSLVALEAGALGRPLVATSVGGLPEVIRDGKDGLLVPAEDADALCAALERMIEDKEGAAAMARSLQARVAGDFSLQSLQSGYLKLSS